jgi:hypothetical protein
LQENDLGKLSMADSAANTSASVSREAAIEQAREVIEEARAYADACQTQLFANLAQKEIGKQKATLPAMLIAFAVFPAFTGKYGGVSQLYIAAAALFLCGVALLILRIRRIKKFDVPLLSERERLSKQNELAQEKYTAAVQKLRRLERNVVYSRHSGSE